MNAPENTEVELSREEKQRQAAAKKVADKVESDRIAKEAKEKREAERKLKTEADEKAKKDAADKRQKEAQERREAREQKDAKERQDKKVAREKAKADAEREEVEKKEAAKVERERLRQEKAAIYAADKEARANAPRRPKATHFIVKADGLSKAQRYSMRGKIHRLIEESYKPGDKVDIEAFNEFAADITFNQNVRPYLAKLEEARWLTLVSEEAPKEDPAGE